VTERIVIGNATLYHADCREVLKTLPDCSVDSVVTDPPYELGFMGKRWDSTGVANDPQVWAECLRVLKPGGYLLAFSGTRTQHRMVCAIEDAGFEIRDQIGWAYGSGFPKSLDVSKAIDKAAGAERERGAARGKIGTNKTRVEQGYRPNEVAQSYDSGPPITAPARQWAGWGTALKPAWEPICMARKPLKGTVAANVLAHGTGALNIDGCRIEGGQRPLLELDAKATDNNTYAGRMDGGSLAGGSKAVGETTLGRWPANLIHDGSDEVLGLFPNSGGSGPARALKRGPRAEDDGWGMADLEGQLRDAWSGSAARFFYTAKASKWDRDDGCEGLDEREAATRHAFTGLPDQRMSKEQARVPDRNHHPTVKPTDLMRYLCRLVTPPGGTVLDLFMGSGSTIKAAELEGFSAIGIEMSAEYIAIARRRIASDAPLFAQEAVVSPEPEPERQPTQETLL
jgi:site-specific DNA-methyltransferase (adenine-specific)